MVLCRNDNVITRNHKVIWEEPRRRPSRSEWTRLLRVLIAMQCPLQTGPITHPRVLYIHTAVPYSSYTLDLHCAIWFLPQKLPLPVRRSSLPFTCLILGPSQSTTTNGV